MQKEQGPHCKAPEPEQDSQAFPQGQPGSLALHKET